ncbi:MAG TPA: hypothetical protein VMI54_17925 [Polyangiaceae bacterium]|nr:hypothetical protein [Polyangiaceae bacterium]
MKRIDFFTLARPIQERFVAATRGQGMPVPLLVAKLPLPLVAIGWALLSVLAVAAWLFVVRIGYGKLASSAALQPKSLLVLEIGLLVLAVLFAFQSRRALRKRLRLPFVPTVYLFPIGAIDARSEHVVTHGWDELKGLSAGASSARVSFAHGSFSFPLNAATQGDELKSRSDEFKQKLASADAAEKDLVAMDPLRDNGFKNPFSPADSMRPPRPAKLPLLALALVAGAALLAYGVFTLRNHLGERAIYQEAFVKNSVAGYRDYLARGGTRSDVRELLLPRAELREAVAENNVEAIERFDAAHPNSKIADEVKAALRTALLHALDDAKAKGTITALREYTERYKTHLDLVPELPSARVAYLGSVLDHFQKTAKPSKELWLLARRLIVYADAHPGAKALVRFSQLESHTLEKNEHMLGASAYYGGDKTLPSHFLLGDSARNAEHKAGTDMSAALGRAFPPDLLQFELGAPVPPGPPPKFSEPTVLVDYRLEISSPLVSKKPRGIYSAVGLVAATILSIPDKDPPSETKYTAWHAPDIKRVEAGELLPENVYSDLLQRAWAKYTTKYTAPWVGGTVDAK